MLYDPKWGAQTKADPLTLESLIAWLEKQPPDLRYDWLCCEGPCLLEQYGVSIGKPFLTANGRELRVIFGTLENYSRVCNPALDGGTNTFGRALVCARELLAERAPNV